MGTAAPTPGPTPVTNANTHYVVSTVTLSGISLDFWQSTSAAYTVAGPGCTGSYTNVDSTYNFNKTYNVYMSQNKYRFSCNYKAGEMCFLIALDGSKQLLQANCEGTCPGALPSTGWSPVVAECQTSGGSAITSITKTTAGAAFQNAYQSTLAKGLSISKWIIALKGSSARRAGLSVQTKINMGDNEAGANSLASSLNKYYKGSFARDLAASSGTNVGTLKVTQLATVQKGDTPASTSSSSSPDNTWKIIVAVVCSFVGLVIILAVVYYFCYANKKHEPTDNTKTITDSQYPPNEMIADSSVVPKRGTGT